MCGLVCRKRGGLVSISADLDFFNMLSLLNAL